MLSVDVWGQSGVCARWMCSWAEAWRHFTAKSNSVSWRRTKISVEPDKWRNWKTKAKIDHQRSNTIQLRAASMRRTDQSNGFTKCSSARWSRSILCTFECGESRWRNHQSRFGLFWLWCATSLPKFHDVHAKDGRCDWRFCWRLWPRHSAELNGFWTKQDCVDGIAMWMRLSAGRRWRCWSRGNTEVICALQRKWNFRKVK